jgi:putative MFS transporter
MPFVLIPLLNDDGSSAVFIVIGIAMALVIANVAALGPKTTGRSLEQVNAGSEQGKQAGAPVPNRTAPA